MLKLVLRFRVPFVLFLLLLVLISHGVTAQVDGGTPSNPASLGSTTDSSSAASADPSTKVPSAKPTEGKQNTKTDKAAASRARTPLKTIGEVPSAKPTESEQNTKADQAAPSRTEALLNTIGVGLAAFGSLAASALVFKAWQEAKRGRERIGSADRSTTETLSRLSAQIPLGDKIALKQLSEDVKHLPQNVVSLMRNSAPKPQAGPNAGVTNALEPGSSQDLALSQLKTLVQTVSTSLRDARSDIGNLSDTVTSQAAQIAQIRQVSAVTSTTALGIKRQLDAQPDPRNLPLITFLNQVVDPNDPLAETGQRLQAAYQKLSSGSRDGDYFLDNLAQAVFIPLSVPLASANLSDAQMSHRISFLGAIERTRAQAAAAARAAGLEMMTIEVSKTSFDGNRHDAILGTEIRTDRAELSGKVAEVLRHGFLQKNKDNSMKVLRKAQVRLFLQAQPKAPTPSPQVIPTPAVVPAPPVPASKLAEAQSPQSVPAEPPRGIQPEEAAHAMAPETGNEAQEARRWIETWKGTSVAEVGNSDWKTVAEALTLLHRMEGLGAPALDALLAGVFPEDSPRSILPQLGEATKPLYEAEMPLPEGRVAEVLRVGIDLSREKALNRPVLPQVRLVPEVN